MSKHTTWLICYDITNTKRLREVHRIVDGFGERLQYSIYRCQLTATQKVRLTGALERVIHHDEDRVLMISLGPSGGRQVRLEALGIAPPPERLSGQILI